MSEKRREELLEVLTHLRVNAIYAKKKHANAADRKHRYATFLRVSSVLLSSVAGSFFLGFVSGLASDSNALALVGAGLALAGAVLAALYQVFQWYKQSEAHASASGRMLRLVTATAPLRAQSSDPTFDDESLAEALERLAGEYHDVQEDADRFYRTSSGDYRKARQGISDGEDSLTPEERAL